MDCITTETLFYTKVKYVTQLPNPSHVHVHIYKQKTTHRPGGVGRGGGRGGGQLDHAIKGFVALKEGLG